MRALLAATVCFVAVGTRDRTGAARADAVAESVGDHQGGQDVAA